MSEAVRIITEQVRLRVRRDGVDLASDNRLAEQYVHAEVQRYSEQALGGSLPLIGDEHQAAREVVASLTGFGALQSFLGDPDIEEIWINSPSRIFVARDGVPELTTMVLSEREVRDLVERMLQSARAGTPPAASTSWTAKCNCATSRSAGSPPGPPPARPASKAAPRQ